MSVELEGNDGVMEIEPIVSIKIPQNEIIMQGCCITYAGQTVKIKGDKKLIKFFEDNGAVENGEYKVTAIGSDRLSVEEYNKMLAFDKLDMEGILEKYLPLADCFSLTCAYGENAISEEIANGALKRVREACFKTAEEQFMLAAESERNKLPPFKKIYEDVEKEYREYCREHTALIDANDGYACFSDVFSGDKVYSSLEELWHTYNEVDFAGTCEYILEKLKKCKNVRPLDEELFCEENIALKNNLIKTEVTFEWHCTVSGELSKVFYIKLNEETANWLRQFKSDYDLDGLEDLAFYKNGKLLFPPARTSDSISTARKRKIKGE